MENAITKNSTRPLLNQQFSLLLRDFLTTVQCHLANQWMQKILVQENHSVSFWKHWTSILRLISAGFVPINQSARQSEQLVCFVPVLKRVEYIQNKSIAHKISLQLYSTIYLCFSFPNIKLLSKIIYWRSIGKTVSS